MGRPRPLARQALLIGIGMCLGVMGAEGILRLRYPRMVGSYQGLYTLSESVGYKLKANCCIFSTTDT